MTLNGKTAVVTGAGGAIGAAVSAALAEQGVYPIMIDRDHDALARAAGMMPCESHQVVADLAHESEIQSAVRRILRDHDCVDILVNNAGILSNNKLQATGMVEWRRTFAVNLESALWLTKGFIDPMVKSGWGRIVNMSSYAAKCGGLTAGTAYSTSKAALSGLTFSVAREYAGRGITANAIAPAYVLSPMVSEQLSEKQRACQISALPVGRFCTPEEVAHTVAFLCSPLAGFITGEVIDMNGGLQFD
ncbi:SDR family NAD(P)-dependent oxidoreductase [Nitratireductor sp. XY-223]|uniref:SDR family NAD(P)-dependent oxidoreductase n=1 Tax=Nitratireductor sp. XY-223 TaxID=2561926 RepID=UPI0010A9E5AE|nr:SDR family NAD(P)-dependent oxidoreductase [Nitratireductor sp. XY-223]